jgi:hypothetical protein
MPWLRYSALGWLFRAVADHIGSYPAAANMFWHSAGVIHYVLQPRRGTR